MKRLSLALFLAAAVAMGQSVDSSQIKVKTNGGLTGDTANSVVVAPYQGSSAPTSPVTGQLWCDTNTAPCSMKQFDGSAWQAVSPGVSIPVQTDSTFPGSPVDGQIFYDKTGNKTWIYNGTTGLWCMVGGGCTGVNITYTFTGSTITAPSGAPTIADNATAGTLTTGNKSCKFTYVNSTGGETTASPVSNTVNFTASHTIDFSGITTGGTGTTQRRIYCSKAGAHITGPWYWVWTINDNSATTATASNIAKLDAAFVLLMPKNNYSAALPAGITVTNTTASTTSGGCGSTGSSMVCYSSDSTGPQWTQGGLTTDPTVRAAIDVNSYKTGNYTIQYRITKFSQTSDTGDGTMTNPSIGGMRVGSADNVQGFQAGIGFGGTVCNGSSSCGGVVNSVPWTSPLAANNNGYVVSNPRTSVGGIYGVAGCSGCQAIWTRLDTVAWVRWVKSGNALQGAISKDAVNWVTFPGCSSQLNACQNAIFDVTSNNPTQWEIDIMTQVTAQRYYVELDNWTLTVN